MIGPIVYIRKQVFGVNQAALADIAGVSQGTVSKWESGELAPDQSEMSRIRQEAMARGVAWDDRWFFEAPPVAAE